VLNLHLPLLDALPLNASWTEVWSGQVIRIYLSRVRVRVVSATPQPLRARAGVIEGAGKFA